MKIYKLGRIGDDGTQAFYDEATGFVVRAESSAAARQVASKKPGDEKAAFWLDPKKSYCKVVEPTKRAQIILRAFDAG